MRVAIMQPYFMPYIGYFQLISSADRFVVYDDIQYTKRGWINRNRILVNGADAYITIPLRRDSDYLDIRERVVSDAFDRAALINRLRAAYGKAPFFAPTMRLVDRIIEYPSVDLFDFLHQSLIATCGHIDIDAPLVRSSDLGIDRSLRGQDRVIATCHALDADVYVNAPGGRELYDAARFADAGLRLEFIQPEPYSYTQFGETFVPWLSILDVLMFNAPSAVRETIENRYRLT